MPTNFRTHLRTNNKLLTCAALFFGAVLTMLLLNNVHNIALILGAFIALSALSYLAVAAAWYYIPG